MQKKLAILYNKILLIPIQILYCVRDTCQRCIGLLAGYKTIIKKYIS